MAQGQFGSTHFGSSATGTSVITRNELIEIAYRKIGITVNEALYDRASVLLNLIIREEDLKGTKQSKNLWALYKDDLFLTVGGNVYSGVEGLSDGIVDLVSVVYRDTGGNDSDPLSIIDAVQYETIKDKNALGTPTKVYLKQDKDMVLQTLYVWPAAETNGVSSEVIGSDAANYACIMGHTADATNYPITGANWNLYWANKGSSGAAWVNGTNYTNGPLLRYIFKRALFSFTSSSDNPDMPMGWTRYLIYRLAHEMCAEQKIPMEERLWLQGQYMEAYNNIFPSLQPITNDFHNKGVYF